MNETSIQVTIAGRTYPLTVADGEAARVREAAGRIDELVQRFQRDYGVSDRQDLMAMAALQLLSLFIANTMIDELNLLQSKQSL